MQKGQSDSGHQTPSGIPVRRIYTEADVRARGGEPNRGMRDAGEFPYTRGIDPEMYRKNLWVMGMYSGYGSPEETNKRLRYLLDQGQTGFSVALDLPTQLGMDSDDAQARGEVGKVGVAIDTVHDMMRLFDGIPLERIRQFRTSANSIGPIWSALCLAVGESQGLEPTRYNPFLQNDVLKEYVARGTYIFPPEPALEFAVDVMEFAAKHAPNWVSINACGYHMRDAGCDAVQELAFTFANACAYIDAALRRNVSVDQVAPTMFMFLNVQSDLFEEVAKFRAARRMWTHLLQERYGARDSQALRLKIFCYTGGSTLTYQQPLNNVSRVTLEALAAVLGGVQTLATSSYDEALGLPTPESAKLSLRSQQIIAYESGVTRTVDPLGGSYYVESLTDELEERAMELFRKVEGVGGAVAAIKTGWIQKQIADAAYQQQRAIDSGARKVVGVNCFQDNEAEADFDVLEVDRTFEELQIKRMADLRAERSESAVRAGLRAVQEAARTRSNTIPPLLVALKAGATLGETCHILKEIWGEQTEEVFSL